MIPSHRWAEQLRRRARTWPVARRLRRALRLLVDPAEREAHRARAEAFEAFERAYGRPLSAPLADAGSRRRALVVSVGAQATEAELGLIKGLELAGYEPIVLSADEPWLGRYYGVAGVKRILNWEDFLGSRVSGADMPDPERGEGLVGWTYHGIRVGRCAASSALRALRIGALDQRVPRVREELRRQLEFALSAAEAARRIVDRVQPDLAMFVDRGYSPQGELFDECLQRGVDVLTWNAAHRSNAIMLKRYTLGNRDEHPASLSSPSWELLRRLDWTPARRERLHDEMYDTYRSGDWYSETGTQFGKLMVDAEQLRRRLGIDPGRRTAVIFPHILWDGTFFWGTDLFASYEEWFVETVRAASANPRLNWLIKVHPANLVKNRRDRVSGEPAEVTVLRERVGSLPGHMKIVPAESEISTYSLFGIMDYCITVRGTVGMEAAAHGVRTLTAGTGRYDAKGFTLDHPTREAYLRTLAGLEGIPPPSAMEHELAQRFAYGVLVIRPLWLRSMTLEFSQDAVATPVTRILVDDLSDRSRAADLRAFAEWANDRLLEDFLDPSEERRL